MQGSFRSALGWLAAAGLLACPRLASGQDERLPLQVVPIYQDIELALDPQQPGYTGSVSLKLRVKEKIDRFAFHAQGLALQEVGLRRGNAAIALQHQAAERTGIVWVTTGRALAPGDYFLSIRFSGELSTRGNSLFKVDSNGHGYVFSHFEPDDARRAFPCWDEPSFKIPYRMTLKIPVDQTAVTNTPVERQSVAAGIKTLRFAQTKPLPSYLLAVAVGPFERVPISGLGVPGNIFTVQGKSSLTAEASKAAPPLLAALERYFGQPYPYEKLDFIAIPGFWVAAMENPGAVTFDERYLLLDSTKATSAERRAAFSIMAHELAHMWVGNLVTMEWWDDLWLNESFASWMGTKITAETFPELALDLNDVDDAETAMTVDARPSTRAVRQPVKATDNISINADALVYKKGKAVLAMFEQWLGATTFRAGVNDYLKSNRWGNTTADDLWASLSKASGKDIGASMATFLDQSGIPLVSVELLGGEEGCSGDACHYVVGLSQQRLMRRGETAPTPASLWQIPITFRYSNGKEVRTETVLLNQPTRKLRLQLPGEPAWILPDAGQRGYYRWQIPASMLLALTREAATSLDTRERIGLLGNLAALLDIGAVRGDDYLRILSNLADDPEPQVTLAVIDALEDVQEAFVTSDLEPQFALYVRRTLAPVLARHGLRKSAGESQTVSALRPELIRWLGNQGRDQEVLDYAEGLARVYLSAPAQVDPALVGVVLSLSCIRGDRALFDEYRKRFEAAKVPAERQRYLLALGSFKDPALVEESLKYVLEGPLAPLEIFTIPRTMGNSPRLLQWAMDNYATITARIPPQGAAFMPYFAAGCSPQLLATANAFFAQPSHNSPGTDKQLATVAAQVTECAERQSREGPGVAQYLKGLASTSR